MNSNPCILVVDDDPQLLSALAGRYTCIPVSGPGAGLRAFGRMYPDLVLASTALGGRTLCTQLRAASKTPIILLADGNEKMNIVEAVELGADELLTRPVQPALLRARIDALLRRNVELPASTVCLSGQVYRAVQANGQSEIRFSLTNADGFFLIQTTLKNLCLQEKEAIVVIGRLRSSFDRRCGGHHGWLQAERILPLREAQSAWRRAGALEGFLAAVR